MLLKETRLTPNDRPPELSQGVRRRHPGGFCTPIFIDGGTDSNQGGGTHSGEPFTTRPQASGLFFGFLILLI